MPLLLQTELIFNFGHSHANWPDIQSKKDELEKNAVVSLLAGGRQRV